MSIASSRSVSRSGTPRPHPASTSTTATTSTSSLSSLTQKQNLLPTDPTSRSNNNDFASHSDNNYFSYPVSRVVSGLYRRLTDPPPQQQKNRDANGNFNLNINNNMSSSSSSSLYTPKRTASPFQPPPLSPLTLKSTSNNGHILSRALAEEIRLLVPPRLQLVDTWRLGYSLERDGSSLVTLYDKCREVADHNPRAGYVLVVRDSSDGGAVFGAYLTDPPHPSSHFYGTGECFLWRASVLASTPMMMWNNNGYQKGGGEHEQDQEQDNGYDNTLGSPIMTDEELQRAGFPPPPSADTTFAVRSTTLRASTPTPSMNSRSQGNKHQQQTSDSNNNNNLLSLSGGTLGDNEYSGTSTPERIRFKAFPYSGINDYMMFCETGFLSVGGGDGHYGLWIDDMVEKGVSDSCLTFGNEPLSDEGKKFDILGVEIWYIGR